MSLKNLSKAKQLTEQFKSSDTRLSDEKETKSANQKRYRHSKKGKLEDIFGTTSVNRILLENGLNKTNVDFTETTKVYVFDKTDKLTSILTDDEKVRFTFYATAESEKTFEQLRKDNISLSDYINDLLNPIKELVIIDKTPLNKSKESKGSMMNITLYKSSYARILQIKEAMNTKYIADVINALLNKQRYQVQ